MSSQLSMAGKIELIRSVLYGNFLYYLQSFCLPSKVISQLVGLCRGFFWGLWHPSWSWREICRPKSEGGLGLRRITDLNLASGMKLVWRLLTSQSLWAVWMRENYLKTESLWEVHAKQTDSGTWKFILNSRRNVLLGLSRLIGDGVTTSLWWDPWIPGVLLADHISLESIQMMGGELWTVSKLIRTNSWHVDIPALYQFKQAVENVHIRDGRDSWIWILNSHGKFTYKSAWEAIREQGQEFRYSPILWFPYHVPKYSICTLRALLNRLPTKSKLVGRGTVIDNLCVLCNEEAETVHHLFFQCSYTKYVWSLCKLKLTGTQSIGDLHAEAHFILDTFTAKDKRTALGRVCFTACIWMLWQERNQRIFSSVRENKVMLARRLFRSVEAAISYCAWHTEEEVETCISLFFE